MAVAAAAHHPFSTQKLKIDSAQRRSDKLASGDHPSNITKPYTFVCRWMQYENGVKLYNRTVFLTKQNKEENKEENKNVRSYEKELFLTVKRQMKINKKYELRNIFVLKFYETTTGKNPIFSKNDLLYWYNKIDKINEEITFLKKILPYDKKYTDNDIEYNRVMELIKVNIIKLEYMETNDSDLKKNENNSSNLDLLESTANLITKLRSDRSNLLKNYRTLEQKINIITKKLRVHTKNKTKFLQEAHSIRFNILELQKELNFFAYEFNESYKNKLIRDINDWETKLYVIKENIEYINPIINGLQSDKKYYKFKRGYIYNSIEKKLIDITLNINLLKHRVCLAGLSKFIKQPVAKIILDDSDTEVDSFSD